MCGRFETTPSLQTLVAILKNHNIDVELRLDNTHGKTLNIAPSEEIFSIYNSNKNLYLSKIGWGIKFTPDSPLIFNSRIETIKEKKFWGNLFDKNRALVPMTGFYEWKKEKNNKVPYRIYLPDEEMFFVPALFHTDINKNISASLITTTPNDFIKSIHHRMPVILKISEGVTYLKSDKKIIFDMCVPYNGEMEIEKAEI